MHKGCHRNLEDHCCWLGGGVVCPHLEQNTEEGFKWTCGLRRKEGSWEAVYKTKEYQKDVQPFWDKYSEKLGVSGCGSFTCVNCIDINGSS